MRSRRRDPLALAGVLGPDRAGQAVDRVVGDADRVVLVGEGLDGEHRTEGLLAHDAHPGAHVAQDRSAAKKKPSARAPSVTRWPPTRTVAPSATPASTYAVDLVEVALGDQRTGLGLLVEGAAEPDVAGPLRRARRRTPRAIDSSTTSRAPAEQTWPECRNTAVMRDVERRLAGRRRRRRCWGSCRRARGRPSSPSPAAAAMIRLPVPRPPVKETRSTRSSSLRAAPAWGPSPRTRLPTPAGRPASSSRRIRWIDV